MVTESRKLLAELKGLPCWFCVLHSIFDLLLQSNDLCAYGFMFCAIVGKIKQWLYSLSSFKILCWGFPLKIMLIVIHVSQSRHIPFFPLKENIIQTQSLSGDFQMYKHVFTVVPCLALTNFDYVWFMSFRGNQKDFICFYMFFKNYLQEAFTSGIFSFLFLSLLFSRAIMSFRMATNPTIYEIIGWYYNVLKLRRRWTVLSHHFKVILTHL